MKFTAARIMLLSVVTAASVAGSLAQVTNKNTNKSDDWDRMRINGDEHRCTRKGLFFKGFRAPPGRLWTLWNGLEQPSWCPYVTVLINEVAGGGWGVAGHGYTLSEIPELVQRGARTDPDVPQK